MARRVYSDFDAELVLRLQKRSDITSTQRGFFLNDALRMIVNNYAHPEYDGQADESVTDEEHTPAATDIMWPKFVKDMDNDRPIDLTSMQDIESMKLVSGTPDKYYWFREIFRFNRTPTAALAVRIFYKKAPTEWITGSPGFAQLFDPLIPMKAAQIALSTVGNQQAAHIQEIEYNNYVAEMKLPEEQHEKNDRRMGVRPRMR